ncbi:flagellar M-ring protein FliF [Methylomonas sp. SURF-2]|uniref:Flagellar M-ring protein n=1 Tax=Methylomonas subterranea TaxID=2952225 RepID=A0ABT1TKT9_9GAMM|nr:flagellar basal-body MS-ring/collar protein FliF [Methylomonas sp. SURF-2]MCQ8106092.1 flagellar M-ring protein FliF [Methylomonas sp. SURF-2]
MSEANNNYPLEAQPQGVRSEDGNIHPALKGLMKLSPGRQIGMMLALALSVAMGLAVVMWAREPSYDLLFSGVAEKDAAEIVEALDKMGVAYKVEPGTGAVMVPAGNARELKLKLAAQGLPRSTSLGYEMLDKDSGFGTSKNVETMRFQRALEGEIALTIQSIQNVKSAKVLLALPVQSVFVRERKKPSASVVVELYQGRVLDKEQVESIVHLVASSVPLMEAGQVTVVDQKGRLLNSKDTPEDISLTSKQFEYKKNIEEHLRGRIENILAPLVGNDGMRAQISADVDFTVTEKTQEMFNPDLPALRSEQTQEDVNNQSKVQGVPGALSNQPPPTGVAPEVASGQEKTETGSGASSKSATRNYELDKTITHTRLATGALRRLSVAVVVDDKRVMIDGNFTQQAYSQEDLNQLRDLVKQAVGYDGGRGDQVTVTNVAFRAPEALEDISEPFWEKPWFMDVMKMLIAAAVLLLLIFKVLRPVFATLIGKDEKEEQLRLLEEARLAAEEMGGVVRFDENGKPVAVRVNEETGEVLGISGGAEDLLLLEAPQSYEKRLEYVQKLIDEDPKLVAQVIKIWLKEDG